MDWASIFILDVPLFEIILRGSVMYIALFVLLRVVLKRQTGSLRMSDLLLITLIADASQNAMAAEYRSLPAGLILVSTILFWSYSFDWLGFQFVWFRKLTEPPPLPLIKDGKLLRKNMRRELITEDELKSQIREQGLEDWEQVKEAFMESDGHISILPSEKSRHNKTERKRR
ncbi:MAG TPA: YetF domain-containing protein [Anaerolineales bacterium]